MGRFCDFADHRTEVEGAVKAFFKKYGIKLLDEKGEEYNPILEDFYNFNKQMGSIYRKEDPTPEHLEAFIRTSAKQQYDFAFDLIINNMKSEPLDKDGALIHYEEPEKNKEFMSDFKSLFEDLFNLVFYKHLTENTKQQLESTGRTNNFFSNTQEKKTLLSKTINASTDIAIEHKAGNTYTNRGMMQQLKDAIHDYNELDNPVQEDTQERQERIDNLMASYVALKDQYEKRNKFARIFNGIDSRKRFKEAEAIMKKLADEGKIQAVKKDGKYDFYNTALNNCKPSKYFGKLTESTNDVKYNSFGQTEFDKAKENEKALMEEATKQYNRQEQGKIYEHYFKQIQKNEVDFSNMTKEDYAIYEKAAKNYNSTLEKDKKTVLGTQVKGIKALLKQAITEHYDHLIENANENDKQQLMADKETELNKATKEKHRSKMLESIKALKEQGIIDQDKYDLDKYEKDPRVQNIESKMYSIVSYDDAMQKGLDKDLGDGRMLITVNLGEENEKNEEPAIEEYNDYLKNLDPNESIDYEDVGENLNK